jgi:hypothetical protein
VTRAKSTSENTIEIGTETEKTINTGIGDTVVQRVTEKRGKNKSKRKKTNDEKRPSKGVWKRLEDRQMKHREMTAQCL